jgi:hypothetical protein
MPPSLEESILEEEPYIPEDPIDDVGDLSEDNDKSHRSS